MTTSRPLRLLAYLVPGLFLAVGVIGWGFFLHPSAHAVPSLADQWTEPGQKAGFYKSWRAEGGYIVGETERWAHKHPRANSYLLGKTEYTGDVRVELRVRFRRGRYLGCYLCWDPEKEEGYWLATGHAIGKFPDQAYVKIVREGHNWKTMARAPLRIIPGREYRLAFRRYGETLSVVVNGKTIVTWSDGEFTRGRVRLRLHNTKVEILELTVHGTSAGDKTRD